MGQGRWILAVEGGDGKPRGFLHAPPRARSGSQTDISDAPLAVKVRSTSVDLEHVSGVASATLCWAPQNGVVTIPHHKGEVHTQRLYGCARTYAQGATVALIEGSPGVVFDDIAQTLSALSGLGIEFFQFKVPRESPVTF